LVSGGQEKGDAVNFMVQNGFDVKKEREAGFQPWLVENESKLAEECPEGITYLGTFANIFGSEARVGAYQTVWGMDSYAAMDAFSNAIKQGGTFAELMDALGKFTLDRQEGGISSNELSRRVTDAAIWGLD
jgi:hypothetical protein